jgi:ferredoxin-nitrate reductase
VGEENLIQLIDHGLQDLRLLSEHSGAGLGCGSCKPEMQEILKKRIVSQKKEILLSSP